MRTTAPNIERAPILKFDESPALMILRRSGRPTWSVIKGMDHGSTFSTSILQPTTRTAQGLPNFYAMQASLRRHRQRLPRATRAIGRIARHEEVPKNTLRVDDFTAESVSGSEAPPEYQRASLVSQAIFLQEQLAKAHSRIQQLEYFKNLRMPKKELCELAQLVEAEAHLQEVENAIKEREETIKTYYLKEQQMKKALLAKRQTAHQLATHSPLYITLENEADQLTWMGKCMQAFSDAHKAKKPPQPDDASQR
ncbi:hypothetical protein PUNSTDRAFT_52723 [Punctularia strigosozonata HHB-11173 SS5]|uniref:uncharacterized protein n=1 Tax=Punctularia strigosozonata (strain HHB-11173) TaxID=741275 RepID=UPI0004418578|nr:uncharacterized protein PUNSTDRAFT_52723 [Punctularia strigosozonata HHB-11173 SS5]EIN08289.1 hypothetical protein PUNSTDRAFT_52723 [Punctularia strigosozonata HHB-11173 SS5]